MSEAEPKTAVPSPERPWFQFNLGTLFLLFVVAASSLGVFGAWGILVFMLVFARALYICYAENYVHFLRKRLSLVEIIVVVVIALVLMALPAIALRKNLLGTSRQTMCQDNLKQIAHALRAYEEAKGDLPPTYTTDNIGNPTLSWRVLILPYLESGALYNSFNPDEPWNGPINRPVSATIIPTYACPSDASSLVAGAYQTNYLAVVGPNCAWSGAAPRKLADFGAEAADTILVIEVAKSGIAWAEPRDLSIESLHLAGTGSSTLVPSSGHGPRSTSFFTYDPRPCIFAAMADGRVRRLPPECLSPDRLPRLLEIGGCKGVELEERPPLNWPNIAALGVWLVSVAALLRWAVRSRKSPAVENIAVGE